jgi:hypothetical protein
LLTAFAAPAAIAPPNRVASTSHGDGIPRSARTMAGTVVIRRSTMIRGFVSWT